MSTDKALMVRDDAQLAITFTPEAVAIQQAALECAALIGKVSSAEEQLTAVEAQKALARITKLAESSRKEIKEPILQYGRNIDEAAKSFVIEIRAEESRIAQLVGDFQALEMAKVRAAQAAENERLTQIERERFAARAQATSHEQLDAIDQAADLRAQQERPAPVAAPRVEGQMVREEWAWEITDIWALATNHPSCVKSPEVLRSQIKAMLDAGQVLHGVRAWRIVSAGVRTGPERKAIEA